MSWKDSAHWLAENAARIRIIRDSEWLEKGACRGLDPDLFFPERGESERPGKAICQTCMVRIECLTYALDSGEKFGIWGGTSERQRRTMRAKRRSRAQSKQSTETMKHHESDPRDLPLMNEGTEHANPAEEEQCDSDDVRSESPQR